MVNVARNSVNTLVFRKVVLHFRQYPGTDAAGALGRSTYVLRAGRAGVGGLTRPDGSLTLRVPAGAVSHLEIFGSRYEIGLAGPHAPVASLSGVQQRLTHLGYRTGPADGKPDVATDLAVQRFQADHGLVPRGLDSSGNLDPATRGPLETAAGA